MAAFKDIRYRARQPRLGRWWRLWIAGSAWWTAGNVGLANASEGWRDSGQRALAVCVACSAIVLALGLTIAWVRKGRSA